jgi:hypothetical protein
VLRYRREHKERGIFTAKNSSFFKFYFTATVANEMEHVRTLKAMIAKNFFICLTPLNPAACPPPPFTWTSPTMI